MGIRIVLAENHSEMRDGLIALIEKKSDFKFIASANDGYQAVDLIHKHKPNVAIMDISMPLLNGIEASDRIRESEPDTKIVALSMHSERRFVVSMLKAGANGFILKDCAFDELANAIRAVYSNRIYLSKRIMEAIANDFIYHLTDQNIDHMVNIGDMERTILRRLSDGEDIKKIEDQLALNDSRTSDYLKDIVDQWLILND